MVQCILGFLMFEGLLLFSLIVRSIKTLACVLMLNLLSSSLPPGDLKKTIEIVIRDDLEPEDNESLMIGLVNTEGGSRILPSSDTVTIVILANDNVAGIVGFHPASRSVIAREGRSLFFN